MAQDKDLKTPNVPPLRFPGFSDEWMESTIGEVAPLQRGFDLPNQQLEEGEYPVVYSNGIMNHHASYKCKAPGIITGRSGTVGKFTYIDDGYYWPHNTSLWVTGFFDNNPKFIYYLFQTIRIEQYSTGSGVPTLNRNDVHRHKVRIPKSIDEQNKIARLLSILDERIATQNKIIDNLQSLINGLNDKFHEEVQGELVSFSEIGIAYSGLSGKSGDDFGQGYPFITYLNVYQNNVINEDDFGLVTIAANESQHTISHGDVLFTLSSETPDEVGIGSVYLGESDKFYLNSFCFGVSIPNKDRIYPPYLAYLVSSTKFRKFVYPLAQGSTRFNLQKNDFMKKKFILPKIEEQRKFATTLDVINAQLANEKRLNELYMTKKEFLLREMFI